MTMHFGQSSALHVCTTYSKLSCNLNVKPLLVREQQTACLTLLLLNPLMGTLKLHSSIKQYGDWYSDEGPGQAAATPSPLLTVPNVTDSPPIIIQHGTITTFAL